MKIVIVATTYPRGMGYIGTMLPKYLAILGVDVHYVTTDLPHYFQDRASAHSYSGFEGGTVSPVGAIERIDGYTVHTLGHQMLAGQPRIKGLEEKLLQLKPDVVQVLGCNGWLPIEAAYHNRGRSYRLFTTAHTTHSVFPLARRKNAWADPAAIRNFVARWIPGHFVNRRVDFCIAATDDCADVAHRFFGVPLHKLDVIPLGVDTELFYPAESAIGAATRQRVREALGIGEVECLAIYTGQFTEAKNPLILARAISAMRATGIRIRALFIGGGAQQDALTQCDGCTVLPFKPVKELGDYYRAADIGVWPTQESTSMLDAAACGLPIVVNHSLVARERIDGNGLTYQLNDLDSLIDCLTILLSSEKRRALGDVGAERIRRDFSWRRMVERRLALFEMAQGRQTV